MEKKYTESQIQSVHKKSKRENMTKTPIRQYGVSEKTFYEWVANYEGIEFNDMKKREVLQDENIKLKKMVAEFALENMAMKEYIEKKYK